MRGGSNVDPKNPAIVMLNDFQICGQLQGKSRLADSRLPVDGIDRAFAGEQQLLHPAKIDRPPDDMPGRARRHLRRQRVPGEGRLREALSPAAGLQALGGSLGGQFRDASQAGQQGLAVPLVDNGLHWQVELSKVSCLVSGYQAVLLRRSAVEDTAEPVQLTAEIRVPEAEADEEEGVA